jgi:putative serine protease PepD
MKRTRVFEVGSLVLLVAGLSLGACGRHASNRLASGASSSGLSPIDVVSSVQADFVAVVNKVRPSVVEITTSTGLGSGVVYDGKG